MKFRAFLNEDKEKSPFLEKINEFVVRLLNKMANNLKEKIKANGGDFCSKSNFTIKFGIEDVKSEIFQLLMHSEKGSLEYIHPFVILCGVSIVQW